MSSGSAKRVNTTLYCLTKKTQINGTNKEQNESWEQITPEINEKIYLF